MMGELMTGIFNTSVAVGAGIAVFNLLLFFRGKNYSAKCRKAIWIVMAFCLLIPFQLVTVSGAYTVEIPNIVLGESGIPKPGYADLNAVLGKADLPATNHTGDSAVQNDMEQITPGEVKQMQTLPNVSGKEITVADALFVIWACVGAAMAVYYLAGYWRMRRKIRRWSYVCEDVNIQKILAEVCGQYEIKRNPELRILQDPATGPFTTGVLKNIIVLPDEVQKERDMRFILKHEMLHCKNKDILWKLLFLLASMIHWFNPLVWVLRRAAEQDMEIACDEEVVRYAAREDREEYSDLIMSWVERSQYKGSAVSTGYVQGVKFLKRRFDSIINGGRRKNGILLVGAACAFVLLIGNMIHITMQNNPVVVPARASETVKVTPGIAEYALEKPLKDTDAPESDGSQDAGETVDPGSGTMQELEGLMTDFSRAYFNGDIDAIGKFLVDDYEWGVDAYESPDQADELEMIQIKGFRQIDERHPSDRYIMSIEFRIPGEDSLTYLTATWRKENEDWKISGYGLEK